VGCTPLSKKPQPLSKKPQPLSKKTDPDFSDVGPRIDIAGCFSPTVQSRFSENALSWPSNKWTPSKPSGILMYWKASVSGSWSDQYAGLVSTLFRKIKLNIGMRTSPMRQLCLLTTLIVVSGTTNVAAMPLTPFRYETQAQRHCPDDTVVWLDFRKGIYYFKRQNRYAQGSTGSFVCREEARSNDYRRSLLGLR
jgi:hypothetical protein